VRFNVETVRVDNTINVLNIDVDVCCVEKAYVEINRVAPPVMVELTVIKLAASVLPLRVENVI
jgi:hypothetical protein